MLCHRFIRRITCKKNKECTSTFIKKNECYKIEWNLLYRDGCSKEFSNHMLSFNNHMMQSFSSTDVNKTMRMYSNR